MMRRGEGNGAASEAWATATVQVVAMVTCAALVLEGRPGEGLAVLSAGFLAQTGSHDLPPLNPPSTRQWALRRKRRA